jgi:hypothetical protein
MEKNLIQTNNENVDRNVKVSGTAYGYISYRGFCNSIVDELGDVNCSDFIDEKICFKALVKLGILKKGKFAKNKLSEGSEGAYYPKNDETTISLLTHKGEEFYSEGIYMRKRETIGFNAASNQYDALLKKPMLELLCEFNKAMVKAYAIHKEQKEVLKMHKLPTHSLDFKRDKKKLVAKFFN